MFNDIRDWLSFAIGVVSLILALKVARPRHRYCRRERFCSIEWTTYDRDDDSRS
ncbi:hypothetical protein [Methylosinus sp. KRF6]|uniref:hypothetical protein n=1 Tax=Methylosinus sp. KRF6 TaxID=2846853 RepID=UPI001C0D9CC7|nr:hypothetical protein [Methylosinus sp. KRF6]MBU3890841.1 hypothetical protein [Methylosinus sp. KRF6]